MNNEEKVLLGLMEDRGWDITNRNMREDEKGELTYIGGRGESVMDYVLVNQKAWEKIEKIETGNREESDHRPLELEIGIKKEREIESYKVEIKEIIEWGKENIELYR